MFILKSFDINKHKISLMKFLLTEIVLQHKYIPSFIMCSLEKKLPIKVKMCTCSGGWTVYWESSGWEPSVVRAGS
jgi:hypothetical protein